LSRRRRAPALESDGGELPVIGDDEGYADDVRRSTASLEMVSRCPIASSRREGRRLETRRAEVSFESRRRARFAAEEIRRRGQGGVHRQEDERSTVGGRRGHLVVTESMINGGCTAVLRRAISTAWRRVWFEKKGETGEEVQGLL
jgi:hypothetical protein